MHPAMAPNFENMGGVAARELPVDLALGEVDALDVVSNVDEFAAMELNDTETFAHTSPVYVRSGSRRLVVAADAGFYEEWIDKLIAQVNSRGRFQKPEQRKEVIDLFRRAQEIYRQLQRQSRAAD